MNKYEREDELTGTPESSSINVSTSTSYYKVQQFNQWMFSLTLETFSLFRCSLFENCWLTFAYLLEHKNAFCNYWNKSFYRIPPMLNEYTVLYTQRENAFLSFDLWDIKVNSFTSIVSAIRNNRLHSLNLVHMFGNEMGLGGGGFLKG